MSKLIKIAFLVIYCSISIIFIKTLVTVKVIDIVEIEYILGRPSAAMRRELKLQRRVVSLFTMKSKVERLPTDFKYILKWTQSFSHYSGLIHVNGQQPFIDGNCTINNCYITNSKGLLADITYFDAILFDAENNWDSHPLERSQYQRFIFVAAESADNFPICPKVFDNYYNLTWTYKLDSDISNAYIEIVDKNGTTVGPKPNMKWIQPMDPTPKTVRQKIITKSKPVLWIVSNCKVKSNRNAVANKLKTALSEYNMKLDIYGWCGHMECPYNEMDGCLVLLQENYYFYLSFENSMTEDYVTEKLLHPLMNYAVPIVYGGANYSRFLPPGSYINAVELDAGTIAKQMHKAINNFTIYENYFRWHNHYEYKKAGETSDVCRLCEIMNQPPTFTAKTDFRKWWNTKGAKCN